MFVRDDSDFHLLACCFGARKSKMAHRAKLSLFRQSHPKGTTATSFNVRYATLSDGMNAWIFRKQIVFNYLKNRMPAIVGTQEGLLHQLNDINAAIPLYDWIGIGRDGAQNGEHCAIFYRNDLFQLLDSYTFWLSSTPDYVSKDWGATLNRICTFAVLQEASSGLRFLVFNTHLDNSSQLSRENSILLILERLKLAKLKYQPDVCLVLGDFNCYSEAASPEILTMRAKGWSDCYRILHPDLKLDPAGTFHNFTGKPQLGKIDFVWTETSAIQKQRVVILEATVDKYQEHSRYPSDHFPISHRLKITP